jgi:hypothetical protein
MDKVQKHNSSNTENVVSILIHISGNLISKKSTHVLSRSITSGVQNTRLSFYTAFSLTLFLLQNGVQHSVEHFLFKEVNVFMMGQIGSKMLAIPTLGIPQL